MGFDFSALSAPLRENPHSAPSIGLGGSGNPLTMRVMPSFMRSKPKFRTNPNSGANAKAALSTFMSQHDFVHCFQQAWAKFNVNLVGGIHNLRCDFVGFHDSDFLAQSR